MMGKYTSGERRGAIALGIVALSVAALAIWRNSVAEMPATPAQIHAETAVASDTVKTKAKKAASTSVRHKGAKKKKHVSGIPATPRSPLDEHISQADK